MTRKTKKPVNKKKVINTDNNLTENGKLKILKTSEYLESITKGEN